MTTEQPTTSMQERMADLKETLKKEKVKLTPEVELYIQEHLRAVQDKLQNGEDVYEEDLAFIDEVKMWVGMPEEWRNKYVSIEEMKRAGYTRESSFEASKRGISIKQWLDLLHVAKADGKSRKWIDETFTFPGGGKIEVERNLDLNLCTGLTTLPEGLEVGGGLYLSFCTGLTHLPEGLKVGGSLDLEACTSLTTLPEGLKVGKWLDLEGCTALITLPEGLKVGWELHVNGCTGLTSLPEGLEVGGNLVLSKNLHAQVKKDAKRLKKEGKIKGEIKYE